MRMNKQLSHRLILINVTNKILNVINPRKKRVHTGQLLLSSERVKSNLR